MDISLTIKMEGKKANMYIPLTFKAKVTIVLLC